MVKMVSYLEKLAYMNENENTLVVHVLMKQHTSPCQIIML